MNGGQPAALRLSGLCKRYGKVRALDGLDLEVPRGSICGLVGPNGAGKTTAFGVIGGLMRPDAGRVDLLGEGPFDPFVHAGRVTLLPQDCELNPYTPVRDLVIYFARLQGLGRGEARDAAEAVLEEVDLADRMKQRVRQLSHGMRRRVAVAQALVGSPELALLDEPTSGLDPHLVVRMREVFARRRGVTTLLISSHLLAELEAACDHVIFMESGRCVRSGPLAELTGRLSMVRVLVEGTVDLAGLRARLPGVELSIDGHVLVAAGSEGSAAALNRALLPVLLEAGVGVVEVRAGRSLEETWMAQRGGGPS